jgi:hypothetical protein
VPLIDHWLIHLADPLGTNGLPPRRSLSPDELRWMFHAAELHGVLAAVLRNGAAAHGGAENQDVLAEAMARHQDAVAFSGMLMEQAAALTRLLGNGRATIVKGPVFARRLYPARELRRYTDVDVLVDHDATLTLNQPLRELGFRLVKSLPDDEPQEWKWHHRDQSGMMIEVHRNLVHARSLRRAISLTYKDIVGEEMPEAAERPSTLLTIAGVHGATHNFERLLHVTDVLQAARALTAAADESHLERLIDRTGTRFALVAGLELAARLFGEKRCLSLARALRPVHYAAAARWLIGRKVVLSAMNRGRHVHSWRRTVFRELLKRPQAPRGVTGTRPSALTSAAESHRLAFTENLQRRCQAQGLPEIELAITLDRPRPARSHIVGIVREHKGIKVFCQEWMLANRPNDALHWLCAVLAIIGNGPSQYIHALADLSDGEESGPGIISFCSRSPGAILIPDHIFIGSRGYEKYRRLARNNRTAWDERSNWIVWRGLTTGVGLISKENLSSQDEDLLARVRLCLELKDMPQSSVKLHGIAQSLNPPLDTERLTSAGLLGEYISPTTWCGLKFAIDVDGNTNAWSNFFTRLLMGCCVLKVTSAAGYRQWYYHEIEPWIHYVPVRSDLSDLRERIAWCRSTPAECRQIAMAGQALAISRDYDTEIALASRRVLAADRTGLLRRRRG